MLVVLVVLVLVLLLAPGLLSRTGPVDTTDAFLSPPSAAHWFGTDQLGRDVFSRTVFGARPVLLASLLGVVVAVVAGVALGVASGMVMGPSRHLTAAFTVICGGAPLTRMTSISLQNSTNAPSMRLVPSQPRVLVLSP